MDSPSRRYQPGHVHDPGGEPRSQRLPSSDLAAKNVSHSAFDGVQQSFVAEAGNEGEVDLSFPPRVRPPEARVTTRREGQGSGSVQNDVDADGEFVDNSGFPRSRRAGTHRGGRAGKRGRGGHGGGWSKRVQRAFRQADQPTSIPQRDLDENLPNFVENPTFSDILAEFSSTRPSGLAEAAGADDCPPVSAGGSSDCPQGSVSDDAPQGRLGFPVAQDDFSFQLSNDFLRSDRATCGSGQQTAAISAGFSSSFGDLPDGPADLAGPVAQFKALPRSGVENDRTATAFGSDSQLERASAIRTLGKQRGKNA